MNDRVGKNGCALTVVLLAPRHHGALFLYDYNSASGSLFNGWIDWMDLAERWRSVG